MRLSLRSSRPPLLPPYPHLEPHLHCPGGRTRACSPQAPPHAVRSIHCLLFPERFSCVPPIALVLDQLRLFVAGHDHLRDVSKGRAGSWSRVPAFGHQILEERIPTFVNVQPMPLACDLHHDKVGVLALVGGRPGQKLPEYYTEGENVSLLRVLFAADHLRSCPERRATGCHCLCIVVESAMIEANVRSGVKSTKVNRRNITFRSSLRSSCAHLLCPKSVIFATKLPSTSTFSLLRSLCMMGGSCM